MGESDIVALIADRRPGNFQQNTRVLGWEGSQTMHNCAFCKNPINLLAEWKGNDGRLYCNEFCAEAGESVEPLGAPKLHAASGMSRSLKPSSAASAG
jgi:hypothetical protein